MVFLYCLILCTFDTFVLRGFYVTTSFEWTNINKKPKYIENDITSDRAW